MDIVLFGIQGCGKGTQAKKLVAQYGYRLFEAGWALRSMAAEPTELGAKVKSYIDDGRLVPHEIIMEVVAAFIQSTPAQTAVVFDGIPRDLDQMRDFDALMKAQGREFRCLNLILDEDKAFQRIVERSRAENRADDASVEKIQRRFQLFHEKTSPVIEAYHEQKKMREINADQSIEAVYKQMQQVLGLAA